MPCSSSQKLCNAGEREWAIGQPMIPASRVLPVILIRWFSRHWASCQQHPSLTQKAEQLDQRQAENGKVVAANPREQLHAPALKAIGADRAQERVAFGVNILLDKNIAE